ncbi:TolC family protein [Erwinia psidii]|uniref:TolC family protein n=1 Tax=Erwinia psidii TaxID=69224 RepID=A0A3N6V252_9GAMM|nr:TolC family protein [Erwinia psidii]MCX8960090.1 hypothetical protein [Erwinia psidii]MCX8963636.1 hypothetical protein [Erwinia psidii]RQM39155.1 hypothetical protein EB241_05200 [Erwinia psidii]
MLKKTCHLIIILTLSGCSLAPDYEKPETVIDHPVELKTGSTTDRYSFHDLFAADKPLLDLLEHALNNNYDLQQAMQRVIAARASTMSSVFDLVPGVKLSSSKSTSMSSGTNLITGATIQSKTENYQSAVGVDSYEVDIWGKKINQVQALKYDGLNYESVAAALHLTLMSDLASNWYETLYMIKVWHLLNDKKNKLDQIQKKLNALEDAGQIDVVIMSKFLRGRASDDSNLRNLQREIINRIHKLEFLSGYRSPWLNTSDWQKISGNYQVPSLPQRITSEVIFNRPDVIAAEMKIKSANGSIGAARAAFLPVFNLYASAWHTSDDFGHILSNLSENWTFTPSIVLPVFNWPKNYANLNYARSQQVITVIEYRKTVAQALMDIQDATNNLAGYQHLYSAAGAEVAQHRENFVKLDARYAAGYADLYGYYEAVDLAFTAEMELESNRQQMMAYTVTLLKAIGG